MPLQRAWRARSTWRRGFGRHPAELQDPDGGPLELDLQGDDILDSGTLGSITPNGSGNSPLNRSITYSAGSASGTDRFNYLAEDAWGDGDGAPVQVNVTGLVAAPALAGPLAPAVRVAPAVPVALEAAGRPAPPGAKSKQKASKGAVPRAR